MLYSYKRKRRLPGRLKVWGFRVQGLGFKVQSLGSGDVAGVWDLRFRMESSRFRVNGRRNSVESA